MNESSTINSFHAIEAVRRLEAAGMPRGHAEALVVCMREAIKASQGGLTTSSQVDVRFAQVNTRFAELEVQFHRKLYFLLGATATLLTVLKLL